MKKLQRVALGFTVIASVVAISACGNTSTNDQEVQSASTQQMSESRSAKEPTNDEILEQYEQIIDEIYPIIDNVDQLPQFSELEEGETLATLHTNYGDITMRFFEEYAPMAVENFLTLSSEGYYDGITFHRVIDDFMIQGGDPTGTGAGGESIYGDRFNDEISPYLKHFEGAVAMANAGPDTNGSQFYIVENNEFTDAEVQYLNEFIEHPDTVVQSDSDIGLEITSDRFCSPTVAQKYLEVGGTPSLDFFYTVFGQVVDGMDIVHKIAEVETGDNDKPVEDVIIESVEITQYHKE